ncbi:MAG: ribonuclease Z [Acidobacteriota bacterium]|nr:ribonuclease Z [Acidobacteriota bacterium]
MSHRRLIVLGTSSQVPTKHRNHNGYFLQWDDEGLLFDPGEGTQRQMIRAGVTATQITRILITHFHGDHCLGLAGLIQRLSLDRVPHPVAVYFPASGRPYFERLRHASIFRERAELAVNPIEEAGVIFENDELTIEALPLDHGVDTLGYRLVEKDARRMLPKKLAELGIKGPDIGCLQREGVIEHNGRTVHVESVSELRMGQRVAFVMDTRLCANAFKLAEKADLFICESTYLKSELKDARANGHLTATQAAEIADKSGARKLVLTHFSQRYLDNAPFVKEAMEIHKNCVAVNDGDIIDVPPRLA